jgi:hypothetical protein
LVAEEDATAAAAAIAGSERGGSVSVVSERDGRMNGESGNGGRGRGEKQREGTGSEGRGTGSETGIGTGKGTGTRIGTEGEREIGMAAETGGGSRRRLGVGRRVGQPEPWKGPGTSLMTGTVGGKGIGAETRERKGLQEGQMGEQLENVKIRLRVLLRPERM